MATDTQKLVYFPEIPATETLENQSDPRIDEDDILPGTLNSLNNIRGENTALGELALSKIIPFGTSGVDTNHGRRNTMIGFEAGFNIKLGYDNVGVGKMALYTLES